MALPWCENAMRNRVMESSGLSVCRFLFADSVWHGNHWRRLPPPPTSETTCTRQCLTHPVKSRASPYLSAYVQKTKRKILCRVSSVSPPSSQAHRKNETNSYIRDENSKRVRHLCGEGCMWCIRRLAAGVGNRTFSFARFVKDDERSVQ